MPHCPKCSYKLILLSSRPKYKCALCSKLYSKKEIEFQEFNKRRRIEDIEVYEKERKEHLVIINEIKKSLKLLFNGFSKTPKDYRKEYYEKNKEKIKQLNREWRLRNREYDLKRKQKTLALQYLENEDFKPSNEEIFRSVPTFALSYLLK